MSGIVSGSEDIVWLKHLDNICISWILFYYGWQSKRMDTPLLYNVVSGTDNAPRKKVKLGKAIEQEGWGVISYNVVSGDLPFEMTF